MTSEHTHAAMAIGRSTHIIEGDETNIDIMEHNEYIKELEAEGFSPEAIVQEMSERMKKSQIEVVTNGLFKIRDENDTICKVINCGKIADTDEHGDFILSDLSGMDDDWWSELIMANKALIFARMQRHHKAALVAHLNRLMLVIAYITDEPLDSKTVSMAQIGITLANGPAALMDSTNVYCQDVSLKKVVTAIIEGRLLFDNSKKAICFVLTSKVSQLVGLLAFAYAQLPLAVTALHTILVDVAVNVIPSAGMSYEDPETDVMARPPRTDNHKMINRKLLFLVAAYSFACYACLFKR